MGEFDSDSPQHQPVDSPTAAHETNFDSKTQPESDEDFLVGSSETVEDIETIDAGQMIGRYKLLRLLGKGGMGAVWLAEQSEPVQRRVALKLVRGDLNSKSKVARFEAERQAIAIMDHPNIAKIYDAGTTPGGSPYFVMELVQGIPLNEFCDRRKLSVNERLELMVPVLNAIQHAHQKAIIHRDLKHSNVLVAATDQPTPKVIDFGLAKALGHHRTLTDKTMFTEVGVVVGTLQYMSPEQAGEEPIDIDTRADIYAMGVMIYKLLTGTTPFIGNGRTENSMVAILEKIRKVDPPRPSVRLTESTEDLAHLAKQRSTTPEKLVSVIEGDLDWIVMKALDKDRRRRYDSASALAEEIQRYLRDETVLARPPSSFYIAKKFIRRNRGLVASLASIISLLVLGIIATTWTTVWALNEREKATEFSAKSITAFAKEKEAKKAAQESEAKIAKIQAAQEVELHSYRMKQAWSDWQRSNVEAAWQKLDGAKDLWETRFLRTQFSSSKNSLHGHCGAVTSLDASKDGQYFVSASVHDSAILWDAKTHEKLFHWHPDEEATCIRFSPDSSLVACSTRSNTITFWDVVSGKQVKKLGPFRTDVMSINFCGGNETLIVGLAKADSQRTIPRGRKYLDDDPNPPSIQIISVADGSLIEELNGHTDSINALDCSADGNLIVSGSKDATVKVWEKKDGKYTESRAFSQASPVLAIALSPSLKHVVCGVVNRNVNVWDLEAEKLIRTMVHNGPVTGVAFSNDGTRIASAAGDRTAKIWNFAGEELITCQGHFEFLKDVEFSSDDSEIITASADSTVRVWSSGERPSSMTAKSHADVVWGIAITKDQQRSISVSQDGSIVATDLETGRVAFKTEKLDCELLCVATSPTQPIFVTGGSDFKLRVWNAESGSMIQEFDAHDGNVWSVDFAPDGNRLISSCESGKVKIWNTWNWKNVADLKTHTQIVASVRYSNNGRHIITACDDKIIRIWDAETNELIKELGGHKYPIWRAIYSPDDRLIASSGYNGEVMIWDVDEAKILRQLKGHRVEIAGLAFGEYGSRLFTASDDGTIKVWDVVSGIELFEFWEYDQSESVSLSVTDDGRKLVSGNGVGRLTIRTANLRAPQSFTLRPTQVDELTVDAEARFLESRMSPKELEVALEEAKKCCDLYPQYTTWANLGVVQCLLGQNEDAKYSLLEAVRLEELQYGYEDLRPYVEGHLAVALARLGDTEDAKEYREEFVKRLDNWKHEDWASRTLSEVDQLLNTQ